MCESSTFFQSLKLQVLLPWSLYRLPDPRSRAQCPWGQDQDQDQAQYLFKPAFLPFIGSLAGFGPLGTLVLCSTTSGANWRFMATLSHAPEKAAAMLEPGPF